MSSSLLCVYKKELRLRVVTNSPDGVRRKIDDRGLESRITVLFSLLDHNLARGYREASALVLPFASEGFGLQGLEVVRCGTALYWAGCASVKEIVGPFGIHVEDSVYGGEWAGAIEPISGRRPLDLEASERHVSLYSCASVALAVQRELFTVADPGTH